jgi:deoxyribonuclease V
MELPWVAPANLDEARALQAELAARVIAHDDFDAIGTVAGVDVGFEGEVARAAVVVLSFPELRYREHAVARRPAGMPYVPGFLSFREAPAVLAALAELHQPPDMLLLDGQGIAHPRRLGIAAHIGLLSNLPSIGVAKSRLYGHHGELPPERGAHVPLRDGDEVIGAVLRTRLNTNPVFVSVGHRISLSSAVALVMACTTKYRLPETTRAAHNLASHGKLPLDAAPAQASEGQPERLPGF